MFIRRLKTQTKIFGDNDFAKENRDVIGVEFRDTQSCNTTNTINVRIKTNPKKLPGDEFRKETERFEKELRKFDKETLKKSYKDIKKEYRDKYSELEEKLLELEKEKKELLELKASIYHHRRTFDYKEALENSQKRLQFLYQQGLINKWRNINPTRLGLIKAEAIENENLKLEIMMEKRLSEYHIVFTMKIPPCTEEYLWEGKEGLIFYYTISIDSKKEADKYYDKKKEQYKNLFFENYRFDINKEIEVMDRKTLEKETTTLKKLIKTDGKSPYFND